MAQVIVYSNENGSVSVCYPTGELPINEVLAKDCPSGAIIVEDSDLPQGADAQFFDSWELSGSIVLVNFTKAKAQKLKEFNKSALELAQKRQLNTLTGIENSPDNATFSAELSSKRNLIQNATNTEELIAIPNE